MQTAQLLEGFKGAAWVPDPTKWKVSPPPPPASTEREEWWVTSSGSVRNLVEHGPPRVGARMFRTSAEARDFASGHPFQTGDPPYWWIRPAQHGFAELLSSTETPSPVYHARYGSFELAERALERKMIGGGVRRAGSPMEGFWIFQGAAVYNAAFPPYAQPGTTTFPTKAVATAHLAALREGWSVASSPPLESTVSWTLPSSGYGLNMSTASPRVGSNLGIRYEPIQSVPDETNEEE